MWTAIRQLVYQSISLIYFYDFRTLLCLSKYWDIFFIVGQPAWLEGPHLHICSDWLITKRANIWSYVWATVTKLGMWVVVAQV